MAPGTTVSGLSRATDVGSVKSTEAARFAGNGACRSTYQCQAPLASATTHAIVHDRLPSPTTVIV
jgi:hypothetical protein